MYDMAKTNPQALKKIDAFFADYSSMSYKKGELILRA